MVTIYRIDFRSGLEIDLMQFDENALENQAGQDWSGVELFTPYQIDMVHICVCLTKET